MRWWLFKSSQLQQTPLTLRVHAGSYQRPPQSPERNGECTDKSCPGQRLDPPTNTHLLPCWTKAGGSAPARYGYQALVSCNQFRGLSRTHGRSQLCSELMQTASNESMHLQIRHTRTSFGPFTDEMLF